MKIFLKFGESTFQTIFSLWHKANIIFNTLESVKIPIGNANLPNI